MQKRMNELYKLLDEYDYNYFELDQSIVSDFEYDKLLKELKELEEKFPEYKKANSVTSNMRNIVITEFEKAEHEKPMLSLENAFSKEDLITFDNKIKKETNKKYTYVCELKIDGIAISISFENGKLGKAITRGNGEVGELVTHNVQTIKTLPKNLDKDIEVRGEIFIQKSNFKKIQKDEDAVYANPRNLAAGTIRQLDNKVAQRRNLDIFVYGLTNFNEYNHKTYEESMLFLKENGFKINEKMKKCDDIYNVWSYIDEMTSIRENLEYEIDGIVIKVNEYDIQEKIGYTAKYPKWAIAYKFKSDYATTKLEDIIYTVGRTGKVIPNAVLTPVYLMGSTISKATLHNEDYILEKNIQVGDTVKIIKAGDIIPRVEEVVSKNEENIKFEFIKHCPNCNYLLEKNDKDYICNNKECSGKNIEKIIYFISPVGFDIKGVGDSLIKKLYDNEIINDYIDLFDLTYEKLYQLEGYKEKSIKNALNAIEKSKNITLANFITSLGVKNLGLGTSKEISKNFENIDELINAQIENILEIDGIGEIIAKSLYEFLNDENNLEKIDYLIKKGVTITNPLFLDNTNIDKSNDELFFNNKKIVITGTFENYSRKEIKDFIEKQGGKVSGSVSKNTDYLVCGEKAGSKLDKAKENEVKILKEDELKKIISED